MKIVIDNSNLFAGGGIQVATSFLYDLQSLKTDDEYFVIQSINSAKQVDKTNFDKRFYFYDLSENDQSILRRIFFVKKIETFVKPDCIFTVFGPSYHKSTFPKVVGFALGQILYPESPYFKTLNKYSKFKTKALSYFKSYFFKKNSDALIYETDDAKLIYSNLIKNKVIGYTVSNTLNNIFLNPNKWIENNLVKSELDIIYLTANYPHKNLSIIPLVIDEILKIDANINFKFHLSIEKNELKFDDKYDQYINYLGKLDIAKIPKLYLKMDLLFMPTLLETFSTTYLEAMYMKIPIVCSDTTFARDICCDSALYCAPMNAKEYAIKILNIYEDKSLSKNLVNKGLENLKRFGTSIERTIKYLEIIKYCANANNKK